jgi:nucleoside-diphosphate-sugar epimerase
MTDRVLITGANGFVGRHIVARFRAAGAAVRCAVRTLAPSSGSGDVVVVGEINGDTDWSAALEGVSAVVHLAGRAHAFDRRGDVEGRYRRINVDGTRALAERAAERGIRAMVFVSSVKAAGERSHGNPLRAEQASAPEDAYGRSKLAAERALFLIAERSELRVVVVRPPLVYGPGVRGNFRRLLEAVNRRVPLPLASVRNRRSLIYVENLSAALFAATRQPGLRGTFFVADDPPISTPELILRLGQGLGSEPRLFPVPEPILRGLGHLPGMGSVRRLIGDLEIDSTPFRARTGWNSDVSLQHSIERTATWFREAGARS